MTAAKRPARKNREPSVWVVERRIKAWYALDMDLYLLKRDAIKSCEEWRAADEGAREYRVAEYRRVERKRR